MPDLSIDPSAIADPEQPTIVVVAGSDTQERVSPPHSHVRGQLIGSVRGLLSVTVENAVWVVPAIHAIWLPPHHVHSLRSHGPFNGWSAYIAASYCASLPACPCTIRTSGLLREALLHAAAWPLGNLDARAERVAAVIIDEVRHLPSEPLGLPLPSDARLQRICRALMDDPADPRDLDQWAAWASLSARTLSRRFVSETGFSFSAWRQRVRLLRSLEMLAAGMPVTSIALDLGYASASAFISLFRRTFGSTPALYRQNLH